MEKRIKICRIIHWMSVSVCFVTIIATIVFWKYIPDRIPQHYGTWGQADNWGDKSFIILLIFFVLIMLGSMCIAEYYVKCTLLSTNSSEAERGNSYYIYPMLVIMDFAMQLMLAYLVFCCATARELGKLFLPVTMIGIFAPVIYFVWKAYKSGVSSKAAVEHYRQKEYENNGVTYRSKLDWWLGIILIASALLPLYLLIDEFIKSRNIDWILVGTELFIIALYIPLFRTRYIMYPDHLVVVCIGKERIPYKYITGITETHNPLSSAALSLDRLQIDYRNDKGGHNMILISPKPKKEFMQKLQEKRSQYMD